ncbi:MAG: glycosyltransferase family 39 protein [Caldilineaceae bacterium]|nr:glycosyltransferase family 39 protein [Caldilineaceae bacterium]
MRQLILLFVALLIALWGLSILREGAPNLVVAARDGLFVMIVGALVFAISARPSLAVTRSPQKPTASNVIWLLALGIILGIGAGGWLYWMLANGETGVRLLWPLLAWIVGVLAILTAALWPTRPRSTVEPTWSVTAAQRFLSQASPLDPAPSPTLLNWRVISVWVLLLTALAALLRLWNFAGLPDGCGGVACTAGMDALTFLREGNWRALLLGDAPLYTLLISAGFALFEPGLTVLRWIGLILGVLTIPVFYGAGNRWARPTTALVGTSLLIFAPWHIEMSRYPEAGTLLLLILFATLWAYGWAAGGNDPRRWALAGAVAGLTTLAAPLSLIPVLLIWWTVALPPANWRGRLLYWFALLMGSAPRLAILPLTDVTPNWVNVVSVKIQALAALLLVDAPLSTAWLGMLALLGFIYLLRVPLWAATRLLWIGLLLTGAWILGSDVSLTLSTLTPLLTIFSLSALIALDQLVGRLIRVWTPAVRPMAMAAAAAITLALIFGISTVTGLTALAESPSFMAARSDPGAGIGNFLRIASRVEGDDAPLIFVPQELLNAPSTQLASGGALAQSSRILALDPIQHLPLAAPSFIDLPRAANLLYIAPAADTRLINHLSSIYPGFTAEAIVDEVSQQTLAYVLAIPRDLAEERRGLNLHYVGEGEDGDELLAQGGLGWNDPPPLAAPFRLEATGSLYIPMDGRYLFRIETDEGAQVRLDLDGESPWRTIIDSAEDRAEASLDLAQGIYPLRLTYVTGTGAPRLEVSWQRPNGDLEPLPREALYALEVESGLLANYYTGTVDLTDLGSATLLTRRREPILLATPALMDATAVLWQAKLAAPVDGLYDLSVEAHGRYQLFVDGALLLGENDLIGSQRRTQLLLARGWHDLEIHYQPQPGDVLFQLRWQPPGLEGGAIPAVYFAPFAPDMDVTTLAIPPAPEPMAVLMPAPMIPGTTPHLQADTNPLPTDLPQLPLDLLWQSGSCGDADDQLQTPRGLVISPGENRLYVADAGNARLIIYDLATGQPLQINRNEQLIEPFDLGINALGDVYLLDAVAQQIFRIDRETDELVPLGMESSFYRPRGIGVDRAGTLLIADTGGARIVLLAADGSLLTTIGGPDTPLGAGQPVDVLALPNGAIWAVTAEDGRLWRLDRGQGQVATARANTFDAPHLAGLPNSSFFLTDPERQLIIYFDAEGRAIAQFRASFAKPVGIDAASRDGNLLLAVSDSVTCTVSLWQSPLDALP